MGPMDILWFYQQSSRILPSKFSTSASWPTGSRTGGNMADRHGKAASCAVLRRLHPGALHWITTTNFRMPTFYTCSKSAVPASGDLRITRVLWGVDGVAITCSNHTADMTAGHDIPWHDMTIATKQAKENKNTNSGPDPSDLGNVS